MVSSWLIVFEVRRLSVEELCDGAYGSSVEEGTTSGAQAELRGLYGWCEEVFKLSEEK